MSSRSTIATLYLLGFALDVAGMFVLNAALPALRHDLDASVTETAWISTLNVLGLTVAIPLGGWLALRTGERRVFVTSLAVFCAGALGAMWAPGIAVLLVSRFVQGLGGGLLVPVGQAMAYRAYPPDERAGLTAMVMTAGLIVPACAPAVGGVVADLSSWRWIFAGLALISVVAGALALAWLPVDRVDEGSHRSFDVVGFLLGTAFLLCLPLGLTLGSAWKTLGLACGLLVGAVWSGVAYIRHAGRVPNPILSLALLRVATLRVSSLIYLCVPGVFTGVNLVASLYFEGQLGLSATETGMLMLPWAIASLIAILAGRRILPLFGARPLFLTGMIVTAAGTLLLAGPLVQTGGGRLAAFVAMGLGASLSTSTAQTAAFTAVPTARMGEASSLWSINRQLSFALGSSVLAGLLNGQSALWAGDPTMAYRSCFAIAAALMLLPLPAVLRLRRRLPTRTETQESA